MNFNNFDELKNHFVEPDIFKMLDVIFTNKEIQENMIEFNQNQLMAGVDCSDNKIKTLSSIGSAVYSLFTMKIKNNKGQPIDKVTLYDTGNFYNTFKVRLLQSGYEITANFKKGNEDIRDNFDDNFDFLGLNEISLFEFCFEFIYPKLSQIIRKKYLNL